MERRLLCSASVRIFAYMRVRAVAALAASVALGGCSLLFVKGPTREPAGHTGCTRAQTLPILDFAGALAGAYTAEGLHIETRGKSSPLYEDGPAMVILAGAAALAVSGLVGVRRTDACKRVQEAEELARIMRPLGAARTRASGGDPWLAAGPPPEGFTSAPPQPVPPDAGAAGTEVGP
jgi:hypothetical protein